MLNFVGIGAQKAGTTWLYENLKKHPEVAFPAGKEIHFWNHHKARGIDWYRGLFETGDDSKKIGEVTPAYGMLPVDTIREVHAEYPNLKLIYMIRNPIERAWSSALMALGRAELEIDEASDQWFIDHFNSQGSRKRGDYLNCIKSWLEVYPRTQLLILRHSEVKTTPVQLLHKTCRFIGVDPSFYSETDAGLVGKKVFAGSGHKIRPSLEKYLHTKVYTEKVEKKLEQYLDTLEQTAASR